VHLVDETDAVPLRDHAELLSYFSSAGKPASQWRAGTELGDRRVEAPIRWAVAPSRRCRGRRTRLRSAADAVLEHVVRERAPVAMTPTI